MAKGTVLPASRKEGYAAVPGSVPPTVPFDQASHSVWEEGPVWKEVEVKAEAQILKQEPLPSNGFLQRTWIRVETESEGDETAGAAAENFPYNILSRLEFQDQGGKPLSSMTGYHWFIMDLFSGCLGNPVLSTLPTYSKVLKKPSFTIVIPHEINPTGFGSLTNLTQVTRFQLQPTIATESAIYKTKMTKNPKFKITTWIESWPLPDARTKPEPGFPEGRIQEQRPPLEGTIRFFTEQANVKVTKGENQFAFSRVGKLIRTQIVKTENTSKERKDTILPATLQYIWAKNIYRTIPPSLIRDRALTQLPNLEGLAATKFLEGIYPFIYSTGTKRMAGDNSLNTLNATTTATKMELKGEFEEGLLTVLTEDLAIAAVSEQARRETPGWAGDEPLGVE